jgi:hypothetical protein
MKLETFFEKFDQFADVPDAVAKMRELVLDFSANGAAHTSLGQRPRETAPQPFRALKGRHNAWLSDAIRMLNHGRWDAPSGLGSFVDGIPRALPWAGIGRRVAAPEISANGAPHSSLGQRPRKTVTHLPQALKGRHNA